MIIYGTSSVSLLDEKSQSTTCPECEKQGTLHHIIYRRHVHVFWIPMFPLRKMGFVFCENCQTEMKPKRMEPSIKREFSEAKSFASGPIWQFSGLFLLSIVLVAIYYNSQKNEQNRLEYINNPKVGDVYSFEIENGSYSTIKITQVSKDSVFVLGNNYETNGKHYTDEIDKPENYGKIPYGISRERIIEMYNTKKVYDVDRE